MTMRVRRALMLITIEFALLIAATIRARTPCPEKSTPIDDGACFIIQPRPSSVIPLIASQQKASKQCERLRVGGLSWHLPKVDTPAKRINVARALIDYASTHPTIFPLGHLNATDETTLSPFIWLVLRRRGPPTEEDLSNESFWYWTADNSTVELFVNGHFFWASGQPDNLGGRQFNVSEECAIGVVYREEVDDEKKLQFHDKPCAATSETELITARNMIAVVCTAQVGTKSEEPITSKWWFIVICVVAAVVPLALSAVGFAVIYKQRLRRRGKKYSQEACASGRHCVPIPIVVEYPPKFKPYKAGAAENVMPHQFLQFTHAIEGKYKGSTISWEFKYKKSITNALHCSVDRGEVIICPFEAGFCFKHLPMFGLCEAIDKCLDSEERKKRMC